VRLSVPLKDMLPGAWCLEKCSILQIAVQQTNEGCRVRAQP